VIVDDEIVCAYSSTYKRLLSVIFIEYTRVHPSETILSTTISNTSSFVKCRGLKVGK
jgi:hypothetical protein